MLFMCPCHWLNYYIQKKASTIPVINHDGKRIACDGQEAKANILNHFFHSYKWSVIILQAKFVFINASLPGNLTLVQF